MAQSPHLHSKLLFGGQPYRFINRFMVERRLSSVADAL